MTRSEGAERVVLLIVDDEDDPRELMCRMLESRRYFPIGASSVAGALTLLRGLCIDALVTDHAMPDGDGLALVRAVRASAHHRDAAVVMLSGPVSDAVRAELAALGGRYVPKPVGGDEIVAILEEELARARIPRGAAS